MMNFKVEEFIVGTYRMLLADLLNDKISAGLL